ncbi:single-stranded DNA-binding protein [uncultured Rothia sp.]|uniref:single-stranded DNA-binding protein n=1 Tax=uncultured Rothia sp. TaxID=316088 RepID=UPI00288955CC|nr:single-stranded DNA-binding protein [uncultured Rothia sp.]
MSDTILIRGFTASDPALSTLPNGVPVVNFRLASTPRWQDATGTWKEGTTNWYTVKAYRRLAQNIATSIEKGQPLVVSGRQRISRWNREDGTQGTTVEVDALGIGHDLNYGTSTFARTVEKRTVNEGAMQGGISAERNAAGHAAVCVCSGGASVRAAVCPAARTSAERGGAGRDRAGRSSTERGSAE